MKLPRDLSGAELARALQKVGYRITRQTGSHMRLTTSNGGEHHVTIPAHDSLRIGTLAGVLGDVAEPFASQPRRAREAALRLRESELFAPEPHPLLAVTDGPPALRIGRADRAKKRPFQVPGVGVS